MLQSTTDHMMQSFEQRDNDKWGLILAAAGLGSRMGKTRPKQFLRVNDQLLYLHSLNAFLDLVDEAIVVVPKDWVENVTEELCGTFQSSLDCRITVIEGGDSRQRSVGSGLEALSSEIGSVMVHDAARPLVGTELILRVMEGVRKQGACIPVLSVTDTVKLIESGYILKTVERDSLALAQTPQGFKVDLLKEAYQLVARPGFQGTDEAFLVEKLGVKVMVVEGDTSNIKVTRKDDLEKMVKLISDY